MNKKKLYSLVVLLVLGGVIFFVLSRPTTAQQIPDGTKFDKVRKLSQGDKPVCLADNTEFTEIAEEDSNKPFDSFSSVVASVIPDMPAGNIDLNINSYSPIEVKGSVVYSDANQQALVGNLKTFNFGVDRSSEKDPWTLSSFIACTEK